MRAWRDLGSRKRKHQISPVGGSPGLSLVARGDLVFDIGANVGAKAESFVAAGSRVVAVEPQPHCVGVLRRTFAYEPNVVVVPKGLAGQPGTMKIQVCSEAPTISTFSEEWKRGRFADHHWDQEVTVEMTTLDALVAEFGVPRYCKIDVEGFEKEVLAGLSRTLGYLSFEYTKEFAANAVRCLELLERVGYRSFNLTVGEDPALCFADWRVAGAVVDHLRQSADPLLWGDIWARV